MKHPFLLLAFMPLLSSAQDLANLRWMEGTWEMKQPDGSRMVEHWAVHSDHQMIGWARTYAKDGKMTFEEKLMLETLDDNVKYLAQLPNKTSIFEMTAIGRNTATFSDPKNSFPRDLVYRRSGVSLEVHLVGEAKGGERRDTLRFTIIPK